MAEGEIDNLTMEQYLALTQGNQALGVVKPEIEGNVNFEIKSQFIQELREDTFFRNKNDDAHEYVERVLDIVNLFNIPGQSHDAVMLRVFPITLLEPLSDGWIDFLQEPSILGISLKKPLSKGIVHHQRLPSSMKKSATSSRKESRHYTKLGSDNLGRDMKKLKENVHAIQVGCQNCKGTHLDKDCPLNEEVKSVEKAKYGEFGRSSPFSNGSKYHVLGMCRGRKRKNTRRFEAETKK
ncbi:hypothetical protein Tco_0459282 [Tanacetum coccineum]